VKFTFKHKLKWSLDPVAFTREALGVKLFPVQAHIMRRFYAEDKQELVLVAGRRSGKSFLLVCFALYETFRFLESDFRYKYGLARGSPVFGLLAAAKEEQAMDVLFTPLTEMLNASPYFRQHDYKVRKGMVHFKDASFVIRAVSSSARTEVGRTALFVGIDEVASLEHLTSQRAGWQFIHALCRSTATFGKDGHRFLVGSPYKPDDILMQLYNSGIGQPHVLACKYATWEMNPHITFESLKPELERDPLTFWRDFGAQPTASVELYFRDSSLLDNCPRCTNILELIYDNLHVEPRSTYYVLAGDPAIRHDAFGLAVGHKEGDEFIIDGAFAFKPEHGEISPRRVHDFIIKIASVLPVRLAVFDTWHFALTQDMLRRKGIRVVNHVVKRQDYDALKELLHLGKITLPDYPQLFRELSQLIVLPSGKISEPRGGHKDVADAVCNVIWGLKQRRAYSLPLVTTI